MDKMIKVIQAPENKDTQWSIYKVLYMGKYGEYEAHLTSEEYRMAVIKQKFSFVHKIPDKDINEFQDSVIEYALRDL